MDKINKLFRQACEQHRVGNLGRAEKLYRKIINGNPGHAPALHALGLLAYAAGDFHNSARLISRALAVAPGIASFHNNLGLALVELGRLEEAMAHYRNALRLQPEYAMAQNNLGIALRMCGDYDGALEAYTQALRIDPANIDAHWNRAYILLLTGALKEGWREYEWGLKTTRRQRGVHRLPRWDGGKLSDDGILVCTEQGIGDQIMFLACLPELLEYVSPEHCLVELDPRLVPLFARSFPAVCFHGTQAGADDDWPGHYPAVSKMIHMGSLPGVFRNELAQFPQRSRYLQADSLQVERWRTRFKALAAGPVVGISWRGGNDANTRALRSIDLELWAPLLALEGVSFVNLQYGDCSDDIARVQSRLGITVHDWDDADALLDLDDFAARIAALDRVVAIDNSTLHMAGALGVPTLALLPVRPEWRWMLEREDSPWYASLKLLRQSQAGQWNDVITRAAGIIRNELP